MRLNHKKLKDGPPSLPATISRARPGDFSVGSPQSRAAARARLKSDESLQQLEEAAELSNLNPLEQALIEGVEETAVKIVIVHMARVGQEVNRIFGFSSPTPEEVRHNRRVAAAIDQMTDGQNGYLSLSNPAEWNRLKKIVEERIEDEDGRSSGRRDRS